MPKLYLAVCLCFNQKKLEQEIAEHQIEIENEVLKEELFKKLKNIKQLYYGGKLILTQNSMERLMKYLNTDQILNISGAAERLDPDKVERKKKRFMRVSDAK